MDVLGGVLLSYLATWVFMCGASLIKHKDNITFAFKTYVKKKYLERNWVLSLLILFKLENPEHACCTVIKKGYSVCGY
jgi:hypothetical protein